MGSRQESSHVLLNRVEANLTIDDNPSKLTCNSSQQEAAGVA